MKDKGDEWRVGKQASASQVAATRLREWILTGQLAPNEKLPSEFKLTRLMQLSRYSVRAALAQLVQEGLIRKRHGSGTYVEELAADADLGVFKEIVRVWPDRKERMGELLRYRASQVMLAVGVLLQQGRRLSRNARRIIHQLSDFKSVAYTAELLEQEEIFWALLASSTGNLAMNMAGHHLRRVLSSFHPLIPPRDQIANHAPLLRALARAIKTGDSFKAFAYAQYALKQRDKLYHCLLDLQPPTHPSTVVPEDVAYLTAVAPERWEPRDTEEFEVDTPVDREPTFDLPGG
jgi:DNA-binding FadR family transcriptional regulator